MKGNTLMMVRHVLPGLVLGLLLANVALADTPPELVGDYTGTIKGKKYIPVSGVQQAYNTTVTGKVFANDIMQITVENVSISQSTAIRPEFVGLYKQLSDGTYTVPLR